MNLENLKRNKIKTLLQSVSYQIYYATKIDNKNNKIFISDHDAEIEKHFWVYTKAQFDNDENLKPSFNNLTCYKITSKKFLKLHPHEEFLQSQAGLQSLIN